MVAGLVILAVPALAGERRLLLEVTVNDRPTGLIGEFIERDGRLMATAGELLSLGIALPKAPPATTEVALGALPSLRYELDEPRQAIRFRAADAALEATQLGPAPAPSVRLVPRADLGAVMNYDLVSTSVGGRTIGAGVLDFRAFGPLGVASLGLLGSTERSYGRDLMVRLDASITHDDPETMRRLVVGDFISSSLAWSRPVRLGGAQFGTNFALRPDLVTFPLPQVGGSATVPSTVDVLVNGVRQLSEPVQPGPFAVRQLPVVTGAGEVAVVVRDALGRETTRTLPFYASATLLAEALSSYAVELGWIRRNFGLRSDDYRQPAASGSWRRGLTGTLTAEAHAEFAATMAMGGAGITAAVGGGGIVTVAAAGSTRRDGGSGLQVSAGVERVTRKLSIAASVTQASGGFSDLGTLAGAPTPRRLVRATLGIPVEGVGSFALAYVGIARSRQRPIGVLDQFSPLLTADVSLISATWSRPIYERATAYLTGFRNFAGDESYGATLGIAFTLGPRTGAGTSVASDNGRGFGAVQASQSAVLPGEAGWRLYASEGDLPRQLGEAEYKSSIGRVSAGVDRFGQTTAVRGGIQGALAALGSDVMLTNTIQDSFAVVDTGQPGMTVLQENRVAGRTGSTGRLLLPDLRSYDRNRLSIDPLEVGADATIAEVIQQVTPRGRSGIAVRFQVERGASARLRLADAEGKALPIGSVVRHANAEAAVPVGFDGEAFLVGLEKDNRVTATLPDGRECAARFAFAPAADTLLLIGPVPCRPVTQVAR